LKLGSKRDNQRPNLLLLCLGHRARTVLADHIRDLRGWLAILRDTLDNGRSLDIVPIHIFSAMRLDGRCSVTPKGVRRSGSLFQEWQF